jgi:multidrug efflux pump subunit AcrB
VSAERQSSYELHEKKKLSRKGPLAWMTQNPVLANLLMFVVIVGGLFMFSRVKQEVFPEFDLDFVTISVIYPGASPAEVEQAVLLAIEEEVRGIDGVKEVSATASEGVGVVNVEMLLGTNRDRMLADIKSSVDRITTFPVDVERPVVSLVAFRREVLSLVLFGDESERTMRNLAERVRDELLQEPGVTTVELSAVRPPEISIEVPREHMRTYGLTLGAIANAIGSASIEMPGGGVKTASGEVLLRTTERRDHGTGFGEIVVLSRPDGSNVRVSDIGTVIDGFRETDQEASFNGKRAAMVKVFRVGDQTPTNVSNTVEAYMEELRPTLPPGVDVAKWNDRSEVLEERMDLLMRNAFIGLALVMLTLGLFLEIRLAFWVTMGIPISFIGAIFLMPPMDVSVNMISLFAFIVTLGIVVDDAIVVGEAIYKRRRDGLSFKDAAIGGLRDVWGPVTFAVLTTVIAFTPLFFVPGIMGKFFAPIPAIVIAVLLVSLVECFAILPAHLAHSRPSSGKGMLGFVDKQQQKISRLLEWLIEKTYMPTLRLNLRWRYVTLGIGIAMMAVTIGIVNGGRIKFTFMPRIESDVVVAHLEMPFGTPVEETKQVRDRLLKVAQELIEENGGADKISRGIFAEVGSSGSTSFGPHGGGASAGHVAEVALFMVPSDKREIKAAQLAKQWRERVGEVVGAEVLTFKFTTGPSSDPPINFELSHADLGVLDEAGRKLAAALGEYDGVTDIEDGFSWGKQQLDFRLTPEGRSLGITERDLAGQVRHAFFGAEAVRQQRGRDELRVYVRLPESERKSLHNVEQLLLRTPTGGEIPLSVAAEVQRGRAYTSIERKEGRRVINVTADVQGETNADVVVADVQEKVLPGLLAEYPGLTWGLSGRQKERVESMQFLGVGFLLALAAMYALMAIPFRSYNQPAIIMTAIPFGFIGAVGGHLLLGYDLSLMSMMGLVALSGVVVNDSIVLISAINEFRASGMTIHEAVVAGGTRRFRPILLTTLTTFFGLAPMILETSVQARFLVPMALSLGFGVLFATLITLQLVPAIYVILEDIQVVKDKAFRALAETFGMRERDPEDTVV